jgi:hypothetical protein
MLFSKILNLLAIAGSALGSTIRRDTTPPSALEVAANSRLPNVPLPESINHSTQTLLQLLTIWGQAELSAYHETIDKITSNATGFTDFKQWNRAEVLGIFNTHLAVLTPSPSSLPLLTAPQESELQLSYALSLLTHFSVPLIPSPCVYKAPLAGLTLQRDILIFQELNTLLIDALQDASSTLTPALLPILWSIATSKAEQNGFYRVLHNEIPSERAFMTSIPPSLAFSTFSQLLRECPFKLDDVAPVAVPLFEDAIPDGFTYCANLSHVPADLDNLYLSIIVGAQMPVTVKAENVSMNGTIIAFDAAYPRAQEVLEGMVVVALNEAGYGSVADEVGGKTLAASFVQIQQPLSGDQAAPADIICPQSGGTLFWDLIAPVPVGLTNVSPKVDNLKGPGVGRRRSPGSGMKLGRERGVRRDEQDQAGGRFGQEQAGRFSQEQGTRKFS